MSTTVFLAVIAAAAMHAGWNAMVKLRLEPLLGITLISIACGVVTAPLLPFVPVPDAAAWPYIGASLAIHLIYYGALGEAYRTGDLGQIYPIARGTAPLLTALGAHLIVDEQLGPAGTAGLILLTAGIVTLSLKGHDRDTPASPRAIGFALLTAASIALYTLVDGVGGRISTSAASYIVWLIFLDGVMMLGFGLWLYGWRRIASLPGGTYALMLAAGTMSAAAYAIAIWAMTQAPIALVAALRETSVLFAALIGIVVLREPVLPLRIVAACLVVAGVMLVRLR
jgi:drug/metabolite transporter (DMT)-like permease